jgi:hypothetical protein
MKTKLLRRLRKRFAWKWEGKSWKIYDVITNSVHKSQSYHNVRFSEKIYFEDTNLALQFMYYRIIGYFSHKTRSERIEKRRRKMNQNRRNKYLRNWINQK